MSQEMLVVIVVVLGVFSAHMCSVALLERWRANSGASMVKGLVSLVETQKQLLHSTDRLDEARLAVLRQEAESGDMNNVLAALEDWQASRKALGAVKEPKEVL